MKSEAQIKAELVERVADLLMLIDNAIAEANPNHSEGLAALMALTYQRVRKALGEEETKELLEGLNFIQTTLLQAQFQHLLDQQSIESN